MPLRNTINLIAYVLVLFLFSVSYHSALINETLVMVDRECIALGIARDACSSSTQAQEQAAHKISLISLAVGISNFITCPAVGAFSDSIGRKLSIGISLVMLCIMCLSWAIVEDFTVLLIVNAVVGLWGGLWAFFGLIFAVLADLTSELPLKARTRYFGIVESCLWIGLLFGPFLGGELLHWFGRSRCFYGSLGMAVVALLALLAAGEETLPERAPFEWHRANPVGACSLLLTYRSSAALSFMCLCALTGQNGAISVIPFFCQKQFGWDSVTIGGLQSVLYGSSAFGLSVILPILNQFLDAKWICVLAVAWATLAWSAAGFCNEGWQFFLTIGCFALNGIYFPVMKTSITKMFGKERYGIALGAIATVQTMTSALAPAAFQDLYSATLHLDDDWLGPRIAVAFVPAFLQLVATIIVMTMPADDPSSPQSQRTQPLSQLVESA